MHRHQTPALVHADRVPLTRAGRQRGGARHEQSFTVWPAATNAFGHFRQTDTTVALVTNNRFLFRYAATNEFGQLPQRDNIVAMVTNSRLPNSARSTQRVRSNGSAHRS